MIDNTPGRQPVKATTAAQFLGTVPALLGFTPVDSLVIVGFVGTVSQGAVRVDAQQLAADPGSTFAQIEATFAGAPFTPQWYAVTLWLERPSNIIDAAALMFYASMLEDADRPYRDILVVEPNGWQSLLGRGHGPRSELVPADGVKRSDLRRAERTVEEAREDGSVASATDALENAIMAAIFHND